jgi:hypothetical protein
MMMMISAVVSPVGGEGVLFVVTVTTELTVAPGKPAEFRAVVSVVVKGGEDRVVEMPATPAEFET